MADPIREGEMTVRVYETAVREIAQTVAPYIEEIGRSLAQLSQALDRSAATQQLMAARISDLEKQVRLKTPLSKAQERRVNDAIRARAEELLAAKGIADRRAITALSARIRRSVLERYGVSSLREAPAYDYEVAMEQARRWLDLLAIRDVTRAARERAAKEGGGVNAEQNP